jgi:eukaryotic-like serine/threonine-protein kinase
MTAQARLLGGRYQVGELLGYGGMAEVHRGRDLRLGRDVAIKMLRTDLARDATFQERFRREAQNSAALNHPAIVAVYDTGEEISSTGEKLPFIVMEFVNGRTLKEVLAQEQRIQPRRALEIIADICAALEFSHRHGIIHRDIKPGNVMITQNGQVKVMDFGIARALASGTAQYLSPEQARGEAVDARSDVYAAGCVLFELLVGHPPFVGDSPVSVAYQHVREDPRAPSDVNPEVPRDVDAIVLKALAKNPMNRYQSAQEMRADALRAVSGRPVLATPVMTQAETMAMQGQPARQWQPQAATTMQRPIGGMPPAGPEKRSSSWVMAVLAGLGVLVVVVLGVALAMSRNNDQPSGGDASQPAVAQATMPNLVGKTEAQARALLDAQKLTNVQPESPRTDQDCNGTVTKQDPDANSKIPTDQEVSYQLCLAPTQVTVPSGLVGGTKDNAAAQLKSQGLEAVFKEVSSASPLDTVVDVDKAGEKVDPGTKITVSISKANKVKMPKVTDVTEETALALLEQGGPFNVSTNRVSAPDKAPGTVIAQNPAAGATVEKGDKVTITVVADDQGDPTGDPSPTDTQTPGNGGGGGGQVFDQAADIIRQD